MMRFLAWLFGVMFVLGVGGAKPKETDEELRNKVQAHMDTIVDEGAAIVDDVMESIHADGCLQEAEAFVQDVIDVTEETAEDLNGVLKNARARVEERFGSDEAASEAEKG